MVSSTSEFSIDATWPHGVTQNEPDVAHIGIRVGALSYTDLADKSDGTSRTYLRASAVSCALWFVDNWWRLRFEPYPESFVPPVDWRLRHELTSIQGGTLWPPIMIYGEGERILIGPRSGAGDIPGPVRYLSVPLVATMCPTPAASAVTILPEIEIVLGVVVVNVAFAAASVVPPGSATYADSVAVWPTLRIDGLAPTMSPETEYVTMKVALLDLPSLVAEMKVVPDFFDVT